MNASFLDVLHDSADYYVSAVGKRVHIHFGGFLEELVDQNRARWAHQSGLRHVFLNRIHVVGDHHGATAKHVTWPDQHWQSNFAGDARGFFGNERGAITRLRNFQLVEQASEAAAIFRQIDGFRRGADDGHAVALQLERKIQRGLSAELHDHTGGLLAFYDGENVFQS